MSEPTRASDSARPSLSKQAPKTEKPNKYSIRKKISMTSPDDPSAPRIIIDGIDRTPMPLFEQVSYSRETTPQIDIFSLFLPGGKDSMRSGSLRGTFNSFFGRQKKSSGGSSATISQTRLLAQDWLLAAASSLEEGDEGDTDMTGDKAPERFLLPKNPHDKSPFVPEELTITLRETPTTFLLDRPSLTVERESEEAESVLKSNKAYQERDRANQFKLFVEGEAQTEFITFRSSYTKSSLHPRRNSSAQVTTYDIHITYNALRKIRKQVKHLPIVQDPLKKEVKVQVQTSLLEEARQKKKEKEEKRKKRWEQQQKRKRLSNKQKVKAMDRRRKELRKEMRRKERRKEKKRKERERKLKEEKDIKLGRTPKPRQDKPKEDKPKVKGRPLPVKKTPEKKREEELKRIKIMPPLPEFFIIAKTEAFKDAVYIVERMLSSNEYEMEQKIFKRIVEPDPFRLDVKFKYSLELLWTFSNDTVKDRAVTCMCWNKLNENVLAVGYGKFYFRDRRHGILCCWCIKNPRQPERTYHFKHCVQALDFSTHSPNLLAVGFYDGDVIVLDVSAKHESIVARLDREETFFHACVWSIVWFQADDYEDYEEQIMSAGSDGRIYKYRRGKDFAFFQLMRITQMQGKVKGVAAPPHCKESKISVKCHAGANVVVRRPNDTILYYVGSDEGGVHKCSVNYLHQHLDVFLAHVGPVYAMEFSPFAPHIFLTCGADWYVRIWREDVFEPLVSLNDDTMEPVYCATWSPINSSIIASVSGDAIHLWDIRRKTNSPISTYRVPTEGTVCTTIRFTASGTSLVVGDVDGNVYTYSLKDMPFSPFYQKDHLAHCIMRTLVTRAALVKQLREMDEMFDINMSEVL